MRCEATGMSGANGARSIPGRRDALRAAAGLASFILGSAAVIKDGFARQTAMSDVGVRKQKNLISVRTHAQV